MTNVKNEKWVSIKELSFMERPKLEDAFSNKNKKYREAWCIAHYCKDLSENIKVNMLSEEPADAEILLGNQLTKIQVVECVDEGRKRGKFPEDKYVYERDANKLILECIKKKEDKNYSGADSLELLIYLNLSQLQNFDVNTNYLSEQVRSSVFKSISLLNNDHEIIKIK